MSNKPAIKRNMGKFVPRQITADMAVQGYNNEGRGEMIGYIAVPAQHEKTCPYRVWGELCACRIGLWQEKPKPKPRVRVKAISRVVSTSGERNDG